MRYLLLFVLTLANATASLAATTTVYDIPAVNGGMQRYVHFRPDAPIATIINIPGGDGVFGFGNDGSSLALTATCGPIYRNRAALADRGIAVVGVDQTSTGEIYIYDNILAVVRHVRARDAVPVWITGGSASTPIGAYTAATLPDDIPAGFIAFAPMRPSSVVPSIRRPTLVTWHTSDPSAFGSLFYNALTAPVRDRAPISAGNSANCGYHLFNGADAEVVAAVAGFIVTNNSATALGLNFQGLWYRGDAESGWGVNVAHQGDTLFVTWFTYDTDGNQMWLVAPDVRKTSGNSYSGTLFRTTGPPFNSVPFTPIGATNVTQVGTVTLSFNDSNNGTFGYTVNGVTQAKPIVRQVFGPLPTCTAGGTPGTPIHAQDLWLAAPADSEAGWGVNITQQGDILFVTWFTYDANGRGMWIVGPRFERTTGHTFAGPLYRTTGPAFNANPWNPANVAATQVGTGTFTFTAHSAGTFNYTVNGVTQAKNITRQVFGSPATVCR